MRATALLEHVTHGEAGLAAANDQRLHTFGKHRNLSALFGDRDGAASTLCLVAISFYKTV
jgi:hypothetical protein